MINDTIFNDFLAYIKDKDYSYNTKSEKALEQLKADALKENYFEAIKEEYGHLKARIESDKKDDFKKYNDQVRDLLKIEIVSRYYFQRGKILSTLKDDPDIAEAISTITNQQKYTDILSGKFVQPKPEVPVRDDSEDDDEDSSGN